MQTITQFETGNIYEMRFVTDSDLRVKFICVNRTAKTVTLERFPSASESITRRIKVYSNSEYIVDGNYSMAPSINAANLVG